MLVYDLRFNINSILCKLKCYKSIPVDPKV